MGKKILIVGGVAGGASTAARLRRLDETSEIITFEKGPHVSFSNCCLPYHLSGIVKEPEHLILMDPESFRKMYNLTMRVCSEVTKIDRENKRVLVMETSTGSTYYESYDTLVLSPGANAIVPPLPGIADANVFTVKNVVDIAGLNNFIKTNSAKKITVIGGGFIGIEVAENLCMGGYEVTVVEAASQILRPFDDDMVQILHKELYDNGVRLILNDKAVEFQKNNLILESGTVVQGDAVVMAIGVKPDTSLAVDAGLEIGKTGAIKVDATYRTSDKDIYAVGDAIEVTNAISGKAMTLPLAGPAQKQARAAADKISGLEVQNTGFIGSSCIKVFSYNAASTGLTKGQCDALGMQSDFVYITPPDRVGLMPDASALHFKLIYEVPTGKILGAQAIGRGNADKRIDIVATLIKMNGTLLDLKDLELCYAPPFSTAKDVTNIAALVALNILNGKVKQVYVSDVRNLVENNEFIVDVREEEEFSTGHITNAINIPLSQLRERIDEIPKDRTVYLHCKGSQRSYYAYVTLANLGYTNLVNISGSFFGVCFYEYFRDVTLGRTPIVTEYSFI